jgi:diguanylate cyclase (GGDEF)-like protein
VTTQEAIVAVLIAAIISNLGLAIGLIVAPRLRPRRRVVGDIGGIQIPRAVPNTEPGSPVPLGVGPGRPISNGLSPMTAPRLVTPSPEAARAGAPIEAAATGPFALVSPVPADPDTGLELAPAWTKWLSEEEARVNRYGHPATIVLVEVAGLDRLAERLGPEAANRLIPPIATTMRRNARAADNVARLGQARFGALLSETDEIRAINYVERARSACDVWLESGAVSLRLAVGWAEIAAGQPLEVAIQTAESRLNEERRRNRARSDLAFDAGADA